MNSSDFFYLYLHIINQKASYCSKSFNFLGSRTKPILNDKSELLPACFKPYSRFHEQCQLPSSITAESVWACGLKEKVISTRKAFFLAAFFGLNSTRESQNHHLSQSYCSELFGQKTTLNPNVTLSKCSGKLNALANFKKYIISRKANHKAGYGGFFSPSFRFLNITSAFNRRVFSQSFKQNLKTYLSNCQEKESLFSLAKTAPLLLSQKQSQQRLDNFDKNSIKLGRKGHQLDLVVSVPLVDLFLSEKSLDKSILTNQTMATANEKSIYCCPWVLPENLEPREDADLGKERKQSIIFSSDFAICEKAAKNVSSFIMPSEKKLGLTKPIKPEQEALVYLTKFYTASWLLESIRTSLGERNSNIKRVLNQTFLLTQQPIFQTKQEPQHKGTSDLYKSNYASPLFVIPHLIKGLKVTFSGRTGGKKGMAKVLTKTLGRVPSSTLREKVDFAKGSVKTKVGSLGIKVWICYN